MTTPARSLIVNPPQPPSQTAPTSGRARLDSLLSEWRALCEAMEVGQTPAPSREARVNVALDAAESYIRRAADCVTRCEWSHAAHALDRAAEHLQAAHTLLTPEEEPLC